MKKKIPILTFLKSLGLPQKKIEFSIKDHNFMSLLKETQQDQKKKKQSIKNIKLSLIESLKELGNILEEKISKKGSILRNSAKNNLYVTITSNKTNFYIKLSTIIFSFKKFLFLKKY